MGFFSHDDYSDMNVNIISAIYDNEFFSKLSCTMTEIFNFVTSQGTRQNDYLERCLDIDPSKFEQEFEKMKKLAQEHYMRMSKWYKDLLMHDYAKYRESIAKDIEKAFIKSVDVMRLRDRAPLNIYIYRIEKLDSLTKYYVILMEELRLKDLDGVYNDDNLIMKDRKMILFSLKYGSFFSIYEFLLKYLEKEYSI